MIRKIVLFCCMFLSGCSATKEIIQPPPPPKDVTAYVRVISPQNNALVNNAYGKAWEEIKGEVILSDSSAIFEKIEIIDNGKVVKTIQGPNTYFTGSIDLIQGKNDVSFKVYIYKNGNAVNIQNTNTEPLYLYLPIDIIKATLTWNNEHSIMRMRVSDPNDAGENNAYSGDKLVYEDYTINYPDDVISWGSYKVKVTYYNYVGNSQSVVNCHLKLEMRSKTKEYDFTMNTTGTVKTFEIFYPDLL